MVTKPADLTRKTWSKLKPLTMKKTNFGEALEAFATAFAACKQTPNKDAFKKVNDALELVKDRLKFARDVARKDKRKDLLGAMKEYDNLIGKAATGVDNEKGKYLTKVADWVELRVNCLAGMAGHEQTMAGLVKKATATAQTCKATASSTEPRRKQAAQTLARKDLATLEDLRQAYIDTCNQVRTPENSPVIHTDDKDPQYLVELNQVQGRLEKRYNDTKSRLKEGLASLEATTSQTGSQG